MLDVNWNEKFWDKRHDWSTRGEEWSAAYGGSEPQWFGSLYPRLHGVLPADNILEIAPGMGRWTRFLLPLCRNYVGIDLSSKCVRGCQRIFSDVPHAQFLKNDGHSLGQAEEEGFELVFSFDSLVHAEFDVFKSYIPQIIGKLKTHGVAFIHHSNMGAFGTGFPNPDARTFSVSRENIEALVVDNGGQVLIQEIIAWPYGGDNFPGDCLTVFRRDVGEQSEPIHLYNLRFRDEAQVIKEFQSPYSRVKSHVE
jgi:SAM-dependent methyltransferase